MNPDFLASLATAAQSIPFGTTVFTISIFLLVLSILVFVHEYGHFFAARSVGIAVHTFSIGFGKAFATWKDKHGTAWQFAWIPMGGYVQMKGQEDGKAYGPDTDADSFTAKSIPARAWVVVAGPLANLLFAALLFITIMATGDHQLKAEIGKVMPNMPAVGILQEGDLITHINGTPVTRWEDLQTTVSATPNQPLQLLLQRNGQQVAVTLTPQVTTFTDFLGTTRTVGRVGVAPSYATNVIQHPFPQALMLGVSKTYDVTALTLTSLGKMLIGAISPDNLAGPLGIADMTGQTAKNGLFALLTFMAVISINLAIVNLLPLPILDGGHLLFLSYEALRGKPLPARIQGLAFRLGLAFIIAMAVFSTFNDLTRFGVVDKATAMVQSLGARLDK